jgi:hypothetical protein
MLYERLEGEVIPEFYTRDAQGIPKAWVARLKTLWHDSYHTSKGSPSHWKAHESYGTMMRTRESELRNDAGGIHGAA